MPLPSTTAWHAPPIRLAACLPASTAASVVFGSLPLTCSAKTKTSPIDSSPDSRQASDDLRFGVKHLHELLYALDLAAALALCRRLHLDHLQARGGIHAEVGERDLFQLLLA